VIRMAAFPVGKNQHARTLLAEDADDLQPVLPGVFDAAVRYVECLPPCDFQNSRRLGRLARAIFGRAAGAHFALREVENAGAVAALGHLEQRAAAGLLYIIAMRGEGENVERHFVIW
jgi:hypothetical protein